MPEPRQGRAGHEAQNHNLADRSVSLQSYLLSDCIPAADFGAWYGRACGNATYNDVAAFCRVVLFELSRIVPGRSR